MAQKQLGAKKNREPIYFVIYCIIAALGWIVPAPEPMASSGIKIVFLFIASAFGWAFTRQAWPSLMTLLLLPFTGATTFSGLISGTFGNENFVFMILIFAFIAFLTESGTDTFIAAWILNLKIIKGHPWRFLFAFLLVCFILSAFVNFIAMCFFMWSLVYRLADVAKLERGGKTSALLVFCVVASGLLGSSAVPWSPPTLVVLGNFTEVLGGNISAAKYLLFSFPYSILCIFCLLLLCRYVFKLNLGFIKDDSIVLLESAKRTKRTTIGLVSTLAFAVIMILPSLVPAASTVGTFLSTIGTAGKLMLIILVLCFIRDNGEPVFDLVKLATKGVGWGMLIMVAAIFGLSNAIFNADTGISTYLQTALAPILGTLPKSTFIIVMIFLSIGITQFLTNATTAIILLIPTVTLAGSFGIDQEILIVATIITSGMALLFAPGGATSQILHGNRDWISFRQIWTYGVPTLIVYGILIMLYSLLWMML